jgi:hypothetical protein
MNFDVGDEELLQMLRVVARAEDPVPRSVLDFAKLAPSIIPLDRALAELLDERPLVEAAGLRDADVGQLYQFALGNSSVSVDVTTTTIIGEFDGGADWAVEFRDADRAVEVEVQEGIFVASTRGKPFVLTFRRGDEVVSTDWLRP